TAFLLFALSAYGIWLYRDPLVAGPSANPTHLTQIPIDLLPRAQHLLRRARRYQTVLLKAGVPEERMKGAVDYQRQKEAKHRMALLAQRLATGMQENNPPRPVGSEDFPVYEINLPESFPLNLNACRFAFPPPTLGSEEIVKRMGRDTLCVILGSTPTQRQELVKICKDPTTLLVAADGATITQLLLGQDPQGILARLIAQQVSVTRVSPYQTKGGVNREAIFYGRTRILADIMHRAPANYLLAGGRQVGKSSLLKALYRRYQEDPKVDCRYLSASGNTILPDLALEIGLETTASLEQIVEAILARQEDRRLLFLIDEADEFAHQESTNGFKTLHALRNLSEMGKAHFILAGFWGLYRLVRGEYQSPIKNFGDVLAIAALEEEASRRLLTEPMQTMNISYTSTALIDEILAKTGQRANLLAITCSEALKLMDMEQRQLGAEEIYKALDSRSIREALGGWAELAGKHDPTGNHHDRMIVYAMAEKEAFSFDDLVARLQHAHATWDPQHLHDALERLELATILERQATTYTFRVPLFRAMILEQNPQEMLAQEIRRNKERVNG
ncbi:MAG: ATP-binding protein, partial [Magnetococcales bacterium]|nr:ATP-binding protein [Magnetococcales bacterium]